MATSIQHFLPEATLTSREVSRTFLMTSRGNFLCPLHAKFVKKHTIFEAGMRGYWATGMHASGPSVNWIRTQARSRAEGYCHCGCDEEAVLFEFAMWKRWQVLTGTSDDMKTQYESLQGQVMDPRMRLFVKAAYEWDTGLSLDDWLAGASTQAEAAWVHCQTVIDHYQRKLATLSGEPNTKFKCALA
ncbi:hypothetical protein JB92DRAFT_3125020 [Gautieria morchelliformis]|nr:hypothetical protein JB92DRAFT_3125020 [Gautieria morchelliformis]